MSFVILPWKIKFSLEYYTDQGDKSQSLPLKQLSVSTDCFLKTVHNKTITEKGGDNYELQC